MINCPKCGAELKEEQKVCIICGALTPASGFYYQDHTRWYHSRKLRIAGLAVAAVVLLSLIINAFRVMPPQIVAAEWCDDMSQGLLANAQKYASPNLTTNLQERMTDTRAISDDIRSRSGNAYVDAIPGEPAFDVEAAPTEASVDVSLVDPSGQTIYQCHVKLIKSGRRWLVENVN